MLQDWHIVILRARHQAHALANALSEEKAITHIVPLIDIIPLDLHQHLNAWQQMFAQADFLIVTSANAVLCAPASLFEALHPNVFIVTMGKASTQALKEKYPHLMVHYTAPNGATSESVLAETHLQPAKVHQKKIVILAGEGGRTVLADTLSARAADLKLLKVYRQQKPQLDMDNIISDLEKNKKLCFVATSASIVENLLSLTQRYQDWLLEQPLVVVSQRVCEQARGLGFKRVYVAHGAQPSEIVQACASIDTHRK